MTIDGLNWLPSSPISGSALATFTITLVVYVFACWIHARTNQSAWANPVLISVVLLIALLKETSTPYSRYFADARFIQFLLGPAVVALAVPLYRQMPKLRVALIPLCGGLFAGSATAAASAIAIAAIFGCRASTLLSIAPKSVTAGIAMLISARVGGVPSLTAAMVIATGISGAVLANVVYRIAAVRRHDVCGFALGIASHGIGTARAFEISEEAGAYAGLGMAMNGIVSAFILPVVLPVMSRLLMS